VDPVMLVVAPDLAEGTRLLREFSRYERDYRLELVSSGDEMAVRLAVLANSGGAVAMVFADVADSAGVEVLATARRVTRTARCVLLLEWGLRAEQMPAVARALELGVVDLVLTKPTGKRDEEFHSAVTEDLSEWAWTTTPVVEAVKVVGDIDGRGRQIQAALDRLGVPSGLHDADSPVGQAIASRTDSRQWRTLVEVMGSTVLADPTNRQLAEAFGATVDVSSKVFDVAVVGAGPAGLGAAVYAASEGLSTLVLEREAFGGQAGSSSMIRNYLGFPRGITGRQLGRRAVLQAAAFGAGFDLAREVTGLEPGTPHRLRLDDGEVASTLAVVLACGVTYRRLGVPSLEALVGHGVFYGASTAQARALRDADVVVVGAGNSGGQAAVHLGRYASTVTIVARGRSLSASMSAYLIAEIESNERISVRTGTDVVDGGGDTRLEWLELTDRTSGARDRVRADALFVLIGAVTRTRWLPAELQRDDHGFILTGDMIDRARWSLERAPFSLETSIPGVFAAGDVRANDVKRVAAAAGEGSISVPMVHRYLAEIRATA
jgi:thioredoxin reductase (NADPH)